jgi:hypothetical protein
MNTRTLFALFTIILPYTVACGDDSSNNENDNAGGSSAAGNHSGGNSGTNTHAKGGNSSSGGSNNERGGSSATGGTSSERGGSSATGGASSERGGSSATGGTGSTGKLDSATGFVIRTPSSHSFNCNSPSTGESSSETFSDADWICSFSYNGKTGAVYIQSTPTACKVVMSAMPVFTTATAQISFDGKVSELTNAKYDWGGNHHNDSLSFAYEKDTFKYYHSSFGFGWRSCQNMDCLQVSAGSTDSVTTDGCKSDRAIPIVCSQIKEDGSYDSLSVDSFKKCLGDPNA